MQLQTKSAVIMSIQNLQQGVRAIQNGNPAEGARLLRYALKDAQVQGEIRATALLWLAETVTDPNEKFRLYQDALVADGNNEHARKRIATMMAQGLPTSQPPAPDTDSQRVIPMPPANNPNTPPQGYPAQQQPTTAAPSEQYNRPGFAQPGGYQQGNQPAGVPGGVPGNSLGGAPGGVPSGVPGGIPGGPSVQRPTPTRQATFLRSAGILDGPNGQATGFFVTRDGLLATTRFAVGGEERVTLGLEDGTRLTGQIIRSYPALDLTLIHTGIQLAQLFTFSQDANLPENTPLTAIPHEGRTVHGVRRATNSVIHNDWFPTTIADLPDAGGNPIFDDRNMLVGMLTSNANRSSAYVFGLKTTAIFRCVGEYLQQSSTGERRVYCTHCGQRSAAGGAGAFYCEYCGGTLPHAQGVSRYQMPQMVRFYDENTRTACRNCGSHAGYYDNKCLRCGVEN